MMMKGLVSHPNDTLRLSEVSIPHLAGTGRVQLKPLFTHQHDLDRRKEAFDLAPTSNDCLRVAIKP